MKAIITYWFKGRKGDTQGGIAIAEDGTHFAHTATKSRKFKTLKGAHKWLTSCEYQPE